MLLLTVLSRRVDPFATAPPFAKLRAGSGRFHERTRSITLLVPLLSRGRMHVSIAMLRPRRFSNLALFAHLFKRPRRPRSRSAPGAAAAPPRSAGRSAGAGPVSGRGYR